jgi:polyisoprenoid-binding protein YceI
MAERRRSIRIALIVAAAAIVAVVVVPFVYIHFVQGEAPAPLSLNGSGVSPTPTGSTPTPSATAASTTPGQWTVTEGSVVGYRVNEVLFGQSNEAVGRTDQITGSLTVEGTSIATGSFTVDMTTVTSDESRRDEQFNGRIMETASFPTATFELTQPIDLGSTPKNGKTISASATGDLTLHGMTRSVTFDVQARRDGNTVKIVGSIPVTFADYGISNPSFGPVTTQNHGVLEFSLNMTSG